MINIKDRLYETLGEKIFMKFNNHAFIYNLVDYKLYFPLRRTIIANIVNNLKQEMNERIK